MRVFWVGALLALMDCGGTTDRSPAAVRNNPELGGESGIGGATGGTSSGGTSSSGTSSGGTSSGGTSSSGTSSGGTPSSGTPSGGTPSGGTSSSGGSVVAGAPDADGQSGAGGQSTQPCSGLECLNGAELLYYPNRTWQQPAGAVSISQDLAEQDYAPLVGDPIPLFFGPDGTSLEMMQVKGTIVQGKRDSSHVDAAWFNLDYAAGGRFVVKAHGTELDAEYTIYGSGRPIVSSTRGTVAAPH